MLVRVGADWQRGWMWCRVSLVSRCEPEFLHGLGWLGQSRDEPKWMGRSWTHPVLVDRYVVP